MISVDDVGELGFEFFSRMMTSLAMHTLHVKLLFRFFENAERAGSDSDFIMYISKKNIIGKC